MMNGLFGPEMPDMTLPDDAGWHAVVAKFMQSPEGQRLSEAIASDVEEGKIVYPPYVFRALMETPLSDVRVVILGQDPYHGLCQAEGLAFSVREGVKVPPSLRNIKKELQRDLGIEMTSKGSLVPWAHQGVLLLNAILTVRAGEAASHRSLGWERLTDRLIEEVSKTVPHAVFMLWGNFAQTKRGLIDDAKHLVLCANHPSPLSASRPPVPFIGCGHFRIANEWLESQGLQAINWTI